MDQAKAILFYLVPAIFVIVGLVHFYWAVGGKKFVSSTIPEKNGKPLFQPTFTITAIMGLAFFAFAVGVLAFGGLVAVPLEPRVIRFCVLVMLALFFGRMIGDFQYIGLFKKVKGSRFSHNDDLYFIPFCGVLAVMLSVLLRQ
ncbi:MAG: DUF3995 domain-containing protein [SAR324 cluster bacterium]|nr:DUF3995 domain-containing protein [SAR324 cluster bacterium]